MPNNPFVEKMEALSDSELLKVIGMRDEYQPDAVIAAKQVAMARGLIDENFNFLKVNSEQISELAEIEKTNKNQKEKEEKRKRNRPVRIIIWIVVLVAICVGGYFIYQKWNVEQVKKEVRFSIEEETGEKIKEIGIVHKTGNEYEGLAKFESGNEMAFTLTIDGNTFLWKSDGRYELQKGLQNLQQN